MRPEPKYILIRAWTRTKVLTDELEISPAVCAIDLSYHVSFSLETFTSQTWWASLVWHEPKIIGRAVPRSAVRSSQFIYHLSRPLFLDPNPGSNIGNARLIGLTRLKPYSEHNLVSFLADQTIWLWPSPSMALSHQWGFKGLRTILRSCSQTLGSEEAMSHKCPRLERSICRRIFLT